MQWHHDLAWWGVVLSILALILMLPVNLLANFLTPLLIDWISTWGRTSLEKRIAKLEKQLAELEKYPATDEVQNQILWGITNVKMRILGVTNMVAIIIYYGVGAIAKQDTPAFRHFSEFAFIVIILNIFETLFLRYKKDFRFKRSPRVREKLKRSIRELKEIRANWTADHP